MPEEGLFFVFEGVDGSGTTTQAAALTQFLQQRGHDVVPTREPGGTPVAERIRQLVLDPSLPETAYRTELFLYAASRSQHVEELIGPSLSAGKIVVCDRFIASTVAYQSFGRGLDKSLVEQVNQFAVGSCLPDATIFLRLSVEDARLRRQKRAQEADRLEEAGDELQERVALGYESIFAGDLQAIEIDARPAQEEVSEAIRKALLTRWPWL